MPGLSGASNWRDQNKRRECRRDQRVHVPSARRVDRIFPLRHLRQLHFQRSGEESIQADALARGHRAQSGGGVSQVHGVVGCLTAKQKVPDDCQGLQLLDFSYFWHMFIFILLDQNP